MTWIAAVLVALEVGLLFWGPGLCLASVWRIPGGALVKVAVAPALTLAIAGVVGIAANIVGVHWSLGCVVVATIALCAPAMLRATLARSRSRPDLRRTTQQALSRLSRSRGVMVGIAIGLTFQLIPLTIGLGNPRNLMSAWDSVGHFNAVRLIRETGDASSFDVSAVNDVAGAGAGSFDGAAWHAVTALIPDVPDASTVFNVSVLLLSTVPWTLGVAALARVSFPARPRLAAWSGALSGVAVSLPINLVIVRSGMVPNAVAVACLPGVLALTALAGQRPRWSSCAPAVVAVVGLGLTHPNVAITWAVASAVPLWTLIVELWRRVARTLLGLAAITFTCGAMVAAAVLISGSSRMLGLVHFGTHHQTSIPSAVLDYLSGDVGHQTIPTGFLLMIAGLGGSALARRLPRARYAMTAALSLSILYFLSVAPIDAIARIGSPWYGEPRRFAPALVATFIPLAALALDSAPRALLVRMGRARPDRRRRIRIWTAGAVALTTMTSVVGLAGASHATFTGTSADSVIARGPERAMIDRLGAELGSGAIFGQPFSGSAALYALSGVSVIPRSAFPSDQVLLTALAQRLGSGALDPATCARLGQLDIRYLYIDPRPWRPLATIPALTRAPREGVRLLDRGGDAAVYQITGCPLQRNGR